MIKIIKEIFNEKYRPQTFDEIVGLNSEIPKLVKDGDMPHLLFVGPAGGGKTTTARVIIKELGAEVLELNASKDRGIDVIRDRIEPFAKKASDKIKIVFLDEFDAMTPAAMTSLRNFMEVHARTTRFIGTCNYPNKIIEPLHSRFTTFNFRGYTNSDKLLFLKKIVDSEKINIDDATLSHLVTRCKDDIRKMVNFLNKNKNKESITKEDISYDVLALKILSRLKNKQWFELRQELLPQALDYKTIIDDMDYIIFINQQIPISVKKKANNLIQKYQFEMHFSFNSEICFSALLAELEDILQW